MPWNPSDADRFKKGLDDSQKEKWAAAANSALEECQREGGKDCEARAIKIANSVVEESDLKNSDCKDLMESRITGEFTLSDIEIREGEGEGKGKRFLVATLLREGPGNQYYNNYYLKEFLVDVARVIPNSPKQYFNHAKDIEYPERDVRDWASSVVETYIDGQNGRSRLRAKIAVYDNWLWERAKAAPEELALSIEGKGIGDKMVIEGKEYNAIRKVSSFNAVNWVDYPGNAGMGVQVIEKARQSNHKEEAPMLKELIEKFKALPEEQKKAFLAENPEIKEMFGSAPAAGVDGDAVSKMVESKVAELQKKVEEAQKSADSKIAALESEKAALASRVEAQDIREKERAKQAMVDRLLGESKIPADYKTETFRRTLLAVKEHEVDGNKVTEEAQMKVLIEDREKICVAEVARVEIEGGKKSDVSEFDQRRRFALNIFGEDIGSEEQVKAREAAIRGRE